MDVDKIEVNGTILYISFFFCFMQNIADFISSVIKNYHVDSFMIQYMQGHLNKDMKVNGWISLILSNLECIVLQFDKGVFMNQGFVLNEQKVLKVFGNHQIGTISYNEKQSIVVEKGKVYLDHGSRFEGLVLTEKAGKIGIPFGYGEMYDNDGFLVYKGIMINWKRFGYGTSYHNNGCIEYEGYWCDDNRFGIGIVYDQAGIEAIQDFWYNEMDSNQYEGNGSNLSFIVKRMELFSCILADWDISLFYNLESIEIGDNCFKSVQTFKINGLDRLETIKIAENSFTQVTNQYVIFELDRAVPAAYEADKSFSITSCPSLKSIVIERYCFADFAGSFELKELPSLTSLKIGVCNTDTCCFLWNSFVIESITYRLILIIV